MNIAHTWAVFSRLHKPTHEIRDTLFATVQIAIMLLFITIISLYAHTILTKTAHFVKLWSMYEDYSELFPN